MSIIERSNPLNLSYQICIVSGASSPLGTIVCKTLLKANAFVYGVDSHPKHESLNAGMAMHFGFEECDLSEAGVAEQIITGAKTKHRRDRIDVLVNVIEDGTESEWKGISNLSQAVGEIMADEGKGRMINVVGSEKVSKDEAISLSKKIGEQHKGVICNVVVSSSGSKDPRDRAAAKRFKEANSHLSAIINAKDGDAKHSKEKATFYEIGNLTLFLAGDMGDVSNSAVYLDGSYQSF